MAYRRLLLMIAAFAMVAATAHAQTDAGPLKLMLACESGLPAVAFRLTIQNVSTTPTAAVIGFVLGNDRLYLLEPLKFALTRSGVGDTSFDYHDPNTPPRIGGRLDNWLVALPAGASYSVRPNSRKAPRTLLKARRRAGQPSDAR
jgi:hypothetical protein